MKEFFTDKLVKYLPLLAFGALGAIIKGIRKKMPLRRLVGQIIVSAFFAWCIGVTLQHYLNLPTEVIYVVVSLAGMFSDVILDEIEAILGQLKEWVSWFVKRNIKK